MLGEAAAPTGHPSPCPLLPTVFLMQPSSHAHREEGDLAWLLGREGFLGNQLPFSEQSCMIQLSQSKQLCQKLKSFSSSLHAPFSRSCSPYHMYQCWHWLRPFMGQFSLTPWQKINPYIKPCLWCQSSAQQWSAAGSACLASCLASPMVRHSLVAVAAQHANSREGESFGYCSVSFFAMLEWLRTAQTSAGAPLRGAALWSCCAMAAEALWAALVKWMSSGTGSTSSRAGESEGAGWLLGLVVWGKDWRIRPPHPTWSQQGAIWAQHVTHLMAPQSGQAATKRQSRLNMRAFCFPVLSTAGL